MTARNVPEEVEDTVEGMLMMIVAVSGQITMSIDDKQGGLLTTYHGRETEREEKARPDHLSDRDSYVLWRGKGKEGNSSTRMERRGSDEHSPSATIVTGTTDIGGFAVTSSSPRATRC